MAEPLLSAKQFMISASRVPTARPDDTVSSALPAMRSSHDPVFVFDAREKFLYLVSSQSLRYQHRLPPSTKVKHLRARLVPPRITEHTSIHRIARFMLDTRLYTLPVFNENGKEIIGVVSAPVMLRRIARKHPDVFRNIADRLPIGVPATIDNGASLRDVYHFLRDAGRSRVVLVDEAGKVSGLMSRRDVEEAFRKQVSRERYTLRMRGGMWGQAYVEEEVPDVMVPAMSFAITNPLTVDNRTDAAKILQLLLEYKKPSIILLDRKRRPTGLVSTHSVLTAITAIPPEREIPILLHHPPARGLGEFRVEKIRLMLGEFSKKLHARTPVQRVEVTIKEPKNRAQQAVMYDINLRVLLWSGKQYIAHEKQYAQKAKHIGLEDGIRAAMKEIRTQIRRERS